MRLTLKKEVLEMLQTNPNSRERKNRARGVWWILQQHYKFDVLDREVFIKLFPHIQSINRLIVWHQQHNTELRGTDYGDKQVLEEETILELGYQPGHTYYQKQLNKKEYE